MSVINTMLKDLDEREVDPEYSDAVLKGIDIGKHSDRRSSSLKQALLFGMGGVLVVSAVLATLYFVSPYQLVAVKNQSVGGEAVSDTHDSITSDVAVTEVVEPVVTDMAMQAEATVMVEAEPTEEIAPITPVAKQQANIEKTAENVTVNKKAEQKQVSTIVDAKVADTSVTVANKTLADKPVIEKHLAEKSVAVAKGVVITRKMENKSQPVAAVKETEVDTSLLANMNKQMREMTPTEKSQTMYMTALASYTEGDVTQAMKLLKDSLRHDSANNNSRRLLATIYLNNDRPQLASDTVLNGFEYEPGDRDLLRLYLQAEVQQQNYDEAIRVMEQRLQVITPVDVAYLAGLYQKQENHLNAVKLYSKALQLVPAESVWWMGQGISFEALQEHTAALEAYRQSIISGRLSSQLSRYVMSRINYIETQLELNS